MTKRLEKKQQALARLSEAEEKERIARMEDSSAVEFMRNLFASNKEALDLPDTLSESQKQYLVTYSVVGTHGETAAITGLSINGHAGWMQNLEYRKYYEIAKSAFADYMEKTAFQLATGRILKPVVNQGKIVTYERIFDTKLLAMVLKSQRPEKYQDRVDVTTNGHSLVKIIDKATWDAI
jgi:hypothetical protein